MRKIETSRWWPELVEHKDQLSLRELSERFGVTPGAISAAFKRLGLTRAAAPPGPRSRRQGAGAVEELPPEPGERPRRGRPKKGSASLRKSMASVAKGASLRSGSKDDLFVPVLQELGTVPDSVVARKVGVSLRTVASFRARHSIGGYAGPRRRGADRAPRKSKIDPYGHLIGTVADRIVAEKAGVSLNAIRNWRLRREAFSAKSTTPTAAPVSSTSRPPSGAWKVIAGSGVERSVRVVVANSLTEAARRAEAGSSSPVLALEWIGETL